ncbi:MAG TPA: asparagine synthase (glutamine-hydrolyzing) [Puia sp.]|nr:asparagine synthase (glutamine-hydrolyzing) [Puia sp.]
MCGICGFVTYDREVGQDPGIIIGRMNSKLIHRGPDAQDTLLFDNVAFGFSRLSIIGLENGMQPIFSEDRSIVLICNGEIFNYIELRHLLKSKGHLFSTNSDVEVIIHLYEDFGTEFLNMLNGQFAFALYDRKRKTLLCARDPMGVVPFFYTFVRGTFIFGSEIKAILEHPLVEREVDTVGLDQVFTFAGLISPRTLFKNINSLENGHFLVLNDRGEMTDREYWDLIFPEGEMEINGHKEEYYIDKLEELFEASIKLRLRSDVASGLYLSGGLDSSMIAMKVNQLSPEVSKDAFSIDFVDSQYSESVYQRLIAESSNSSLHQKTFFYDDISERLRHSVYHSECPIKETYNTASLSLSEAVRSKGIKVILSGEGADEFFAGYVGYRFDKMRALNKTSNPSSPLEDALRNKLWGDPSFFYETNFTDFEKVKRTLYSTEINSCFEQVNCLNHHVINKNRLNNLGLLNKRAYIDYKIRLVDHLVSDHGDRMALANAVEVRYPFLDKDLIEFSTQIPSELKLKGFKEKYILKRMASRFVPKPVFEREKFHFIAPGSPYLLQKNVEYVHDILSYDLVRRQGYFNPDQIEKLKKDYSREGFSINAPYESDLLITVITFGILLDTFFN